MEELLGQKLRIQYMTLFLDTKYNFGLAEIYSIFF